MAEMIKDFHHNNDRENIDWGDNDGDNNDDCW